MLLREISQWLRLIHEGDHAIGSFARAQGGAIAKCPPAPFDAQDKDVAHAVAQAFFLVERQGSVTLLFDMEWQPGVTQTAVEQEPFVLLACRALDRVYRLDERFVRPRVRDSVFLSLLVCGSMFTSSGTAPRRLLMEWGIAERGMTSACQVIRPPRCSPDRSAWDIRSSGTPRRPAGTTGSRFRAGSARRP